MQGVQGAKGGRGERGERGVKGDNSNVLSVLAEHLPIQLATRYGEKMCFIKCDVSEIGQLSYNWLEMWERYAVLVRTTNPCGILMLNLSMDMKWQTYRKRLVMFIS